MSKYDLISEKEAYKEVIGGLVESGYSIEMIVNSILHLKQHPLTKLRVCLLSRGYHPEECEKLHAEGKYY